MSEKLVRVGCSEFSFIFSLTNGGCSDRPDWGGSRLAKYSFRPHDEGSKCFCKRRKLELYNGFDKSNVEIVAARHELFEVDSTSVTFMRHHACIKLAAAGSSLLNCFCLFFCSTFSAKPEPIIPPGNVQKATPTMHKPVAMTFP